MKPQRFCKGFSIQNSSFRWIAPCLIGVCSITFHAQSAFLHSSSRIAPRLVGVTAQNQVKGLIISQQGNTPLEGVTVTVQRTGLATSTNASGEFAIEAQVDDILEITSVGYLTQRVTVKSVAAPIQVTLEEDDQSLEEVIVTGYSTQRKRDLTGAVSVVDVAELKTQPVATAVEALQGRAPGVQIVTDGAPGATPQIKIRGFSTINNNEPLYVIDGVPYEGKLSWLNNNDIESMQVLKDASAASIYGARANNGVVIITTKTGQEGPPRINIDSYVGLQVPQKDRFPKMLSPQQVLDMENALNGTNNTLPEYLVAGGVSGHNVTPADADMSRYNYGGKDRSTFYQITKANHAGTRWFDELAQVAPTQSYQISAVGGGENATYAMTGGYLNQQGGVIHTGFERFNIRTNTTFKAFDGKLRFGENMQYSFTEGFGVGVNPNNAGDYQDEGSVLGFAYRVQNLVPVYDEGGNFAGTIGGWGNGQNPVAMAYRAKDNKNRSNFFFGNAFAEYDIIDHLTLRTNIGMRYENYHGIGISYPNPEFNEGTFNNGVSEYQGYTTEWTWTNTLTYRPQIGEGHDLTILAGTEAIENRNRDLSGSRNGYFTMNSLDYFYLNAGTTNIGNASSGSLGAMFSIFAKADYALMDRYIFSATVRRDGSSNFGANNLYGVFPGFGAAWRLSEEDFLKDSPWLNDLKLRAGYGVTGNQRIPGNQFLNRFAPALNSSSYPINGTVQTGIWQTAYANEDVKWEQVKSLNLGLDFSLFQGDIDGSLEWYDKRTTDMLFRVPLPSAVVGGAESPYQNIGEMSNKGIEFSLGYHYGQRQDKAFKFDVVANFSRNINNIVALAPDVNQVNYGAFRSMETSVLMVNQPFASFYGYDVVGIYQSEEDVANSVSYAGARPGGLKYADLNGDGVIDAADRTIIGSPHPDFIYSLNFNASYKNFDMLLYFYGSQGNDIYEATRYFTDFGVFQGQKSVRLLDAWSAQNPNAEVPSIAAAGTDNAFEYATSSYYIQDGSFLKLRNVQFGYTVPTQQLFGPNTSLGNLRCYLGVTNVFTLTKYQGLDPEITATPSDYPALGVDFGVYPQARQYLFGLSLGF